jgi:hypothetical protein
MGRMRPSQTVPVVLSLALYGNRDAQLCTLANVLGQTVAPLVVHNSFIGGHRMAAEARALLLGSERGHINPQRNRVSRLAPGILLAHLSNFEHAIEVLTTAAETRFVLLASNMVIVRRGLEEWVARHSLSFCVHSVCNDWPCTIEDLLRGVCAHRLEESLAWPDDEAGSTRLSNRVRALGETQDDTLVRSDPWVSHFVNHLSEHPDRLYASRPAGLTTHEGSWYPRRVLQAFRQALSGTPFEETMLRYNASAQSCPCCKLYGVNGSSLYSTKGSCEFDELLLPTFVWQRHRELLARAAPPLAMRAWQQRQVAGTLMRAMDAAATTVFSSRRFPQAFALKVPHRHSPDVVAMFNATFAALAPDDACHRKYAGSSIAPGWY